MFLPLRFIYPPTIANYSFNWWISNSNEELDWGPGLRSNDRGWDGTPETDKHKYEVMSNREFDYDQSQIGTFREDPRYITPPTNWQDLQDGYDTRFLLSFGPFNVAHGDSETVIIAYMVAENFHRNGTNYCSRRGTVVRCTGSWSSDVFEYGSLASTANWVQQVFDNDWKGPVPPPAPEFHADVNPYNVTLLSNSDQEFRDPITGRYDFEGYRVYIADWNQELYYVPLAEFDKVNFFEYSFLQYDESSDNFLKFYKDSIFDLSEPYTIPILDLTFTQIRETTLVREPYGYNIGMPPDTIIGGQFYYYHNIRNLRPGAEKYVVVTAFDNASSPTGHSVPLRAIR